MKTTMATDGKARLSSIPTTQEDMQAEVTSASKSSAASTTSESHSNSSNSSIDSSAAAEQAADKQGHTHKQRTQNIETPRQLEQRDTGAGEATVAVAAAQSRPPERLLLRFATMNHMMSNAGRGLGPTPGYQARDIGAADALCALGNPDLERLTDECERLMIDERRPKQQQQQLKRSQAKARSEEIETERDRRRSEIVAGNARDEKCFQAIDRYLEDTGVLYSQNSTGQEGEGGPSRTRAAEKNPEWNHQNQSPTYKPQIRGSQPARSSDERKSSDNNENNTFTAAGHMATRLESRHQEALLPNDNSKVRLMEKGSGQGKSKAKTANPTSQDLQAQVAMPYSDHPGNGKRAENQNSGSSRSAHASGGTADAGGLSQHSANTSAALQVPESTRREQAEHFRPDGKISRAQPEPQPKEEKENEKEKQRQKEETIHADPSTYPPELSPTSTDTDRAGKKRARSRSRSRSSGSGAADGSTTDGSGAAPTAKRACVSPPQGKEV